MDDIYLKIRSIRNSKKLTQEEVSKRIGMAQSNYARMERGLSQITVDRLSQLAAVFEMTPEELVSHSESEKDFQEDAKYYYSQVKKLEAKLEKLQKEKQEQEDDENYFSSKQSDEKKKLQKVNSELRRELLNKDQTIREKQSLIDRMEKEAEEKNTTIRHLQDANSKLLKMLSENS